MLIIKKIILFIWLLPRRAVCFLIRGYQNTLSPDHGPMKENFPYGYCKFTPSCSMYSYEVIKKHGVIWGGMKAIWRILRCNPWGKGGYDPPK